MSLDCLVSQHFHTDRWINTSFSEVGPATTPQIMEAKIFYTHQPTDARERPPDIRNRFPIVGEYILWMLKAAATKIA